MQNDPQELSLPARRQRAGQRVRLFPAMLFLMGCASMATSAQDARPPASEVRSTNSPARSGAVKPASIPKTIAQSAALSAIRTHLVNIIQKLRPDEVAVEGIIYVQSHQTAISMGAARAAALIAAADHGCAFSNTHRRR